MDKVRIGIVGAGRLGGFHANKAAASPLVQLIGICDPYEPNRNAVAEKHNVRAFSDLEELLPLVDAVVIAAPTTEHAKLGQFFLRHKKHVLMEKPLAVTSQEADTLVNEARLNNVILQVGHVEEYNPAWMTALPYLQKMKEQGPLFFDAVRTSIYTFRCVDVGAVLDIMIHDLELLLSVVSSPVASVEAFGYQEFCGFEDTANAFIKFQNGSAAHLTASRVEAAAARRLSVRGRGMRVNVDFAARQAEIITTGQDVLRGDYAPTKVKYSEIQPQIQNFIPEHYKIEKFENLPYDALELEMAEFADAILNSRPSKAPGERAAEAVRLAEIILQKMGNTQA